MECTVRWIGPTTPGRPTTEPGAAGMSFVAETGSGHSVIMDGAPDGGGRNLAPRPMEMVLLGTGGCTAYDVVVILRKNGQDVKGCEVRLEAERAPTDPKVFTRVRFAFTVTGRDLSARHVERAIRLSHDKYCSASIMLGKTAEIAVDWKAVDESGVTVAEGSLRQHAAAGH